MPGPKVTTVDQNSVTSFMICSKKRLAKSSRKDASVSLWAHDAREGVQSYKNNFYFPCTFCDTELKMPYWAVSVQERAIYTNLEELRKLISRNFKPYKWRKTESREKFYNVCYIQDQRLKTDKESVCHPNTLNLSSRILADPGFKLFAYI